MLGLGYGLGALLPTLDGQPYVAFLAAGTVCASTMNAATFEALYSSFSRMHVQKTWDAILNTPLGLSDVVAGELFWAATKSLFSGAAILVVISALGLTHGPLVLWALPAIVLTGLAFAALGLIWNALAPSYDFFMYYFTLFITPMTLISGVFFPTDQLPGWLAAIVGAASEWLWRTFSLKGEPPLTRHAAMVMRRECTLIGTKAKAELGYVPAVSVEEGLQRLRESLAG